MEEASAGVKLLPEPMLGKRRCLADVIDSDDTEKG
jgi:hypothetical protein